MSVLKRSAVGLKSVLNRGAWLFLLWMAWTVAQAGGVVVDATRTFTVGQTLSDLQDPPLTVSATITNSPIKILTEVKVGLHLAGDPSGRGFASEIYVSLNKDLESACILLNQVGVRDNDLVGFGYDGWQVTFSDSAASDVHLQDIGTGVMTGEIQPDGRLKPEDILRPAMLSALAGGHRRPSCANIPAAGERHGTQHGGGQRPQRRPRHARPRSQDRQLRPRPLRQSPRSAPRHRQRARRLQE
jgi:hypothetical protein